MKEITSIYVDFDGCLSPAMPGATLDLDLLHLIRGMNQDARAGKHVPFVAINSGRPESFIEAHAQAFDIKEFCVFENGAGIFRFPLNAIELHLDPRIPPSIHDDFLALAKLVKKNYNMDKQPNKEYNLTYLFPEHAPLIQDVAHFLAKRCTVERMPYYIDTGINYINVITAGTSKGTGMQLTVEKSGLDLTKVLGIGDSDSDLAFLDLCGATACPSNGSRALQEQVDFVSPFPHAKGTLDILTRVLDGTLLGRH